MATAMASGTVASFSVSKGSRSTHLEFGRASKLVRGSRRSSAPPLDSIRCGSNADGVKGADRSFVEASRKKKNGGAQSSAAAAVVVPALAAAFLGSVQPVVQASEWDTFVAPVEDTAATSSTDEPYKGLLEKFKGKRAAREKKAPSVKKDEQKGDAGGPSTFSSPFFSPAPVYTPPAPSAPPPVAKTTAPAPAPAAEPSPVLSNPKEVVAPVVAAEKQKTHGFLPLFLTQFLLLVATVGGGYALVTTPDSKWAEVRKIVDGYVSKATPLVEDSWTKAKPVAVQAGQKASQFAVTAKPYVVKAWETSKPLAARVVEVSKPILKSAQVKAAELFEKATSNK